MFTYLFAFIYSYLRLGTPLDICQYGLDLSRPSLSSEVGAGNSLENRPLN